MSALRHLVVWILLLGLPLQAAAAPGWLCAKAGHHGASVAAVHTAGHGAAAHASDHAAHDGHLGKAHLADGSHGDDGSPSPGPELPAAGSCSACSGCFAPAVSTIAGPHGPLIEPIHEVARYLAPLLAHRPADGPFRPPRSLTA